MLPELLQLRLKEVNHPRKEVSKQKPSAAAFRKEKEKKNPLLKEVETGTLELLKQLIKEQKEGLEKGSGAVPYTAASSSILSLNSATSPSKLSALSAGALELFHKLESTLIHMDKKGIQETTFLFMSKDPFSSFSQGVHITVTEYSTAPKIFNIQFASSPAAMALLSQYLPSLMTIFQKDSSRFQIGRVTNELGKEEEREAFKPLEPIATTKENSHE